jgi:hypothetical protein
MEQFRKYEFYVSGKLSEFPAFDTYDILKKRIAVANNNPYVAIENNSYQLFDSSKINFSTITKDELIQLATKFGTDHHENLVREFLINKKEDVLSSYQSLLADYEENSDFKQNLMNIDRYTYTNSFFNQDINEHIKIRQKLLNSIKNDLENIDVTFKKLPAKTDIKATDFIVEYKKILYRYKYIDIYELFNSIRVSESMPICMLKTKETIYKVYNNFKDFKISQLFAKPKKHYSDFYISILYKGKPIFVSYYNSEDKYTDIVFEVAESGESENEDVNDFLNAITIDKELIYKTTVGIVGSFAIEYSINKDIFLDLIMNYSPLYEIIYVDQSTWKNKEIGSLRIVDRINSIKYVLSDKKTGINDIFYKKGLLKIYQDYVNIRIDFDISTSNYDLQRYKNFFLSFVELYKQNFQSIKKEYGNYIDSFKEIDITVTKSMTLKQARPDIFISGYARHIAQKDHQPVIYDKEKHAGFSFNYEGLNLVCPIKENPYPGLKINKLENSEQFPFLPYCYKEDNDESHKNDIKIYTESRFQGLLEKYEKHDKKASNKVKNKAIEYGGKGDLPNIIEYIVDNKDAYRTGVVITENSLMHVLLLAIDKKYITEKDKEQYVQNILNKLELAEPNSASETVLTKLEQYAKLNIYILRSDEVSDSANKNVYFEIPEYKQYYIKNRLYSNSVMIYKHMGRFSDALKFHHYELIMYDKNNSIFEDSSNLGKRVLSYYNKCYEYYGLKDKKRLQHDAEILDTYGKVRTILFDRISMHVSPLAPSSAKKVKEYYLSSFEDVKKFLHDKKLNIIAKDVRDNKLVGIFTDLYNYSYIPIKEILYSENLELPETNRYGLISRKSDNKLLQTFNNRKIADFMMQYALYAYSKSEKTIDLFIEENTEIVENTFLKDVKRELDSDNSFYSNGILKLDSEKTREKIKWYLKYAFPNYQPKKYLDNFYIVPEDYTQQDNVSISFDRITHENVFSLQTVETLNPETKAPQFYMNWLFSKNPILVQNTKNKETAIAVAKNFMENKYNLGYWGDDEVINIEYNEIKGFISKINKNIPTIYNYNNGKNYAALLFLG